VDPETKDGMEQTRSDTSVAAALERFERPLTAYARRFTGDLDAARDVVQDTFLRLCRQPLPADDPRLGPWLFRVCRNRAIDERRKGQPVRLWQEPDRMPDTTIEPAVERTAERREEKDLLDACVRELPPRQGEAVWLKFHGGLTYRQIAEVMDVSVPNVGFLLHTALQELRRRLGVRETAVVEES